MMKRKTTTKSRSGHGRELMLHLILTAVAGLIFWILGEALFPALTEKLYTPLGIALYFLIFSVIIAITLVIASWSNADFSNPANGRNRKSDLQLLAICLAVLLVFSFVFELLYELGDDTIPEPTSYIFLIDDSGSMDGTEADRVTAIRDIMASSDTTVPYAVYSFTANATLLQGMGYYAEGDEENFIFSSYGGTSILSSIADVLNDLSSGVLSGAGAYPKILLLSDGASFHIGLKNVTKSCRRASVSVSTAGMGNCDESFLQQIASLTGGVYVYCTDASDLSASLAAAIATDTDRNLLSQRVTFTHDGLYAFLRILFLCLLGVIWSFMKTRALWEEADFRHTALLLSIGLCVCAALLMEFCADMGSIALTRLVFCLLWAVTPGHKKQRPPKKAYEFDPIPGMEEQHGGTGNGTESSLSRSKETEAQQGRSISSTSAPVKPFEADTDPFQQNKDPFASGSDPFPSNSDPFSTGGSPLGSDPFGSKSAPSSDSFGSADPFSAGNDPFGHNK